MPKTKKTIELTSLAAFVDEIATLLSDRSDYPPSRCRIIVGAYVDWAHRSQGMPLAERLFFDPQVIGIYISQALKTKRLSQSSVAAYRSALLRVCEILVPRFDAVVTSVGQREQLVPYTPKEIDYLEGWMTGQREPLMNRKGVALICLTLGCGLRAGEVLRLRRVHVVDDGKGIIVTVAGDDTLREVPMLRRWAPAFRRLIQDLEPDDYVFGRPRRSVNANAISEFVASTRGDIKPNTYRLRSTWIVGRLAMNADLPTLLRAAGLQRIEKLAEYIPFLPQPTDATFDYLREGVDR